MPSRLAAVVTRSLPLAVLSRRLSSRALTWVACAIALTGSDVVPAFEISLRLVIVSRMIFPVNNLLVILTIEEVFT